MCHFVARKPCIKRLKRRIKQSIKKSDEGSYEERSSVVYRVTSCLVFFYLYPLIKVQDVSCGTFDSLERIVFGIARSHKGLPR